MAKSNIIDVDVIIAHRTAAAVLVKLDESAEGIWLPLSQVEVDGEKGEAGVVTLPEWLAVEKGLV